MSRNYDASNQPFIVPAAKQLLRFRKIIERSRPVVADRITGNREGPFVRRSTRRYCKEFEREMSQQREPRVMLAPPFKRRGRVESRCALFTLEKLQVVHRVDLLG